MKTIYAVMLLLSMQGITTADAVTFDGNPCLGDCSGHQAQSFLNVANILVEFKYFVTFAKADYLYGSEW